MSLFSVVSDPGAFMELYQPLKVDGVELVVLMSVVLGYLGILALLGAVLPGQTIAGTLLADKTRVYYKCNGLASLVVMLAGLGIAIKFDYISPTIIADRGGKMCTATFVLCLMMSVWLTLRGYFTKENSESLKSHATGNIIEDWWLGVQLNPNFLGLDLKFFWIRAGMMGWLLIDFSVAAKQYIEQGSLSPSMALFQLFCTLYIFDYFWHEEYMTSTWDIIAENFGFMLIFGDLVFIPFTFSIQAWWLLSHSVDITPTAAAMNVLVFLIGFAVFRSANTQKHKFKQDPKVKIWGKPAKAIGGRLLVSGCWGISRHCNYLGDILVAFSFSLPCGISSPVPYFYPTYLFILLLWRERRDEARCSTKYKELWKEYCKAVPWRIFPYIY
ncbi:delta(14)-sterol reductase [Physcomitrium patens]|uniref:Delta(14)-sterol reductase n=1 Tax=Physcomitrium patens TaxID=3218 RepID=A0A2K1J8B3_PHYPA|nr:delta(14)-sterol reductase-like [Physcomitrium patens]PNR37759.1 hypothetical protein PHYPA_020868 [Physcomitrium patens]|eukprot:XP_024399116.1 delta(14)-sterol reductase-like [Physcomitrella patens]